MLRLTSQLWRCQPAAAAQLRGGGSRDVPGLSIHQPVRHRPAPRKTILCSAAPARIWPPGLRARLITSYPPSKDLRLVLTISLVFRLMYLLILYFPTTLRHMSRGILTI